jgi:hypothetical protein
LSARTKALIDTGSPRTIFPRGIGDLLALNFPTYPSDAPTRLSLLSREWGAITWDVELALSPVAGESWPAEVDFVMDEGLPWAILGFEGFLNRWAVTFVGAYGYFLVEPADKFDERVPDEVFDDLEERFPGSTGR